MFYAEFLPCVGGYGNGVTGEVSTRVLRDASFSFGWHLLLFQQNVITL